MARDVRPSTRTIPTPHVMMEASTGRTKTKRRSIPTAGVSIVVPTKIQSVYFRNAGLTDIRIRINATGADYWTITPGQISPRILIGGATLDAAAVGSASDLELIFEG